ncbi:Type 1 glutamine amidotransferase-like domain-containing protein [Myroides marinus]|uniref:Type 1 glutamine amidotransferase-like domain-containing protein n=1 Tax=Myroides marinus TaxID=703342 RepID=UPI00257532B1|nr:Type 1 glutamine amidotransferase-like domain-containing protein [Myroides marinus]MDM1367179.1 Type 1 glutamine amidotransferase-like domain-containing protein [Myroides marinus]
MFLTSSFCDVASLFSEFAAEEVKGKKVTFISTASIVEEYVGHVENDQKAFEALGIIVETLEISTATLAEIKAKLIENDYIFVSGGNTFYLLQEMRRSGAEQLIKEQIALGKVYIGTSAGSVIMSSNIEYLEAMDDKSKATSLKSYKGLEQIDKYLLVHYQNFPFTEAADQIYAEYKDKLPLILLSNHQVLTVKNQVLEVRSV